MKVSLSWLKEYVTIGMTPEEIAEALTMAGLEVDAVLDRFEYTKDIIAGRISQVLPHPNADKLTLCQVNIGERSIQVVCGAPNVFVNMLTPLALPGTRLPNGTLIQESVIRGESSAGMLLSAMELGIGDDHSGILDLTAHAPSLADIPAGMSIQKALKLSDPVFEIDLTPNRSDCLSLIGVARELAALQRQKVTYPTIMVPESEHSNDAIHKQTSVTIKNPELCPRYAARLIFDVTIAPSPFWLADRLISVGLTPINNIVDITNFVMMETGQPLHAFDFDLLTDQQIIVRAAEKGETFTTLDHKRHQLTEEMLMICDHEKSVAIGGVMGGLNSEIQADTKRVLLESAYFEPDSIRKTSKLTGIKSDAAHRFERGVDPQGTLKALDRAAALMAEIGGGRVLKGVIDEHPAPITPKTIRVDTDALNIRLGTQLPQNDIITHLRSIEFEVTEIDPTHIDVLPPSFRVDVNRPEDISEEIARLWGYNKIETTFPPVPSLGVFSNKTIQLRHQIKAMLIGLGFNEALNYSFTSAQTCDRLNVPENHPQRAQVPILNPLSENLAVMRTSLLGGLLETMQTNLDLQSKTLKIFEIGKTFFHTGQDRQPNEKEILAGLITGMRSEKSWNNPETPFDFYDLKGVLEILLEQLHVKPARFTRRATEACHHVKPGFAADIRITNPQDGSEMTVGNLGELHPSVMAAYDLKQTAFLFEIDLDTLIPHVKAFEPYVQLPKFPAISRDITMIIERKTEASEILNRIDTLDEPLIESSNVFDSYDGAPIRKGRKSLSLRIVYRSDDRTLDDETVNTIHQNISAKLIKAFNAELPA